MNFKKVSIENFKSIRRATVSLENRGLVLVDGVNKLPTPSLDANGAGKSTALSAVFYALYGELPNGDKADSVINVNAGKGTSVSLEFSTDAGAFIITRGRKKNVLTLETPSGESLTKGTIKETQEVIDSLVSIPKDIFMSTLYFDGHNSQPFSTLTDKQRKEYLETLFSINIFREAHEQTKLDLASKKSEIESDNNEIKSLQYKKEPLSNNLATLNGYLEDYERKLTELGAEVSKKTKEKEEFLDSTKQKSAELITLGESITKEIQNQPSVNEDEIKKLTLQYNSLNTKVSSLEYRENSLLSEIRKKNDTKEKLKVSDICLVCGNAINQEHKERELQSIVSELSSLVEDYKKVTAEIPEAKALVNEVSNKLDAENEKYRVLLSAREEKIVSLNKVTAEANKIAEKVSYLDRDIQYAISSYNNHKGSDDKIRRSIQEVITQQKEVEEKIATIENRISDKTKEYTELEGALVAFSDKGIKSHVLDLVTPEMNNTIQGYLSYLSGGTLVVKFSTQSVKANGDTTDKFDIQVSNNGKETSYSSLSSGEQRRLDLAISLTLQDILMRKSDMKSNLLIYDELFESLDGVGSENVIDLLKSRLSDVSSIFVITHNDNLKPLFDSTMTVVKESTGDAHIINGDVNENES